MELLECRLSVDDLDAFLETIGTIADQHQVTIQAFDARYVADRTHIERALCFADRAIDRGENVARDRAVEILLYAAGRRQIDRALEMGVAEGEHNAVVLVDADPASDDERTPDGRESGALKDLLALESVVGRERTLESPDTEVLRNFFDVPDAEVAATDASLADLVHERVALLEVEK